jgi:hypothetical protein
LFTGHQVGRYQEGGRWNILISLRETKFRGDVEEFFIERRMSRGFFPKARRCHRAVLIERHHENTTPLRNGHLTFFSAGRQL